MHTHRQWGIWEFHLEDDPGAAVAPRDNATFADDWTRSRLERMVRQDAGLAARLRGLVARHGHTAARTLTVDQLVHEVLRLAAVGRIRLAFAPLDLISLPQVAGAAASSAASNDADADADAGSSNGASTSAYQDASGATASDHGTSNASSDAAGDAASSDDAAGNDATSDGAGADGDAAQDDDASDAPSDDATDDASDPAAQPQKIWIEIQLLGEDGKPIPGERYEIQLPDGSTRQGTLDDQGLARVDQIDPGTCQVSFPALDQDAWTAIEADGA